MNKELLDVMAKKRILFINGSIDNLSLAMLKEKMLYMAETSENQIFVVIDSNGGSLEEVWGFCDEIPMISNVVIGLVIGKCYSAAFAVLQACDLRLATPGSRFMPHHITIKPSFSLYETDKKIKDKLARQLFESRQNQKYLEKIVVRRSGLKPSVVNKVYNEGDSLEKVMNIHEALDMNFVDNVVSSISELKSKTKSAKKFSPTRTR